jgi:hypothetical protein
MNKVSYLSVLLSILAVGLAWFFKQPHLGYEYGPSDYKWPLYISLAGLLVGIPAGIKEEGFKGFLVFGFSIAAIMAVIYILYVDMINNLLGI